jgi:uncharacterized protein
LCAEDIEWIIPGEDWPLAGTYRGHAGLAVSRRRGTTYRWYAVPRSWMAQSDANQSL